MTTDAAKKLDLDPAGGEPDSRPAVERVGRLRRSGLAPVVLVVDDEPGLNRLMCLALTKRGFAVRSAAHGAQALECIAQQRPDAVLLDIMMPVLDGGQTLAVIRERWPELPVVIWSGSVDAGEAAALRQKGARAVLLKPALPSVVARTLARCVEDEP
jgi:CheY-like chemotaxis protein